MPYQPSLFSTPPNVSIKTPDPQSEIVTSRFPPAIVPASQMAIKGDTRTQLKNVLPLLSPSDRNFAESMLYNASMYRGFSPRQAAAAESLIRRATQPATASANAVTLGSFAAVIDLFRLAQKKLKYPKVRLMLDNGTPIILSISGPQSSNPGTVAISGEGSYPNRPWYGRVTPAGTWEPSRSVDPATMAALTDLLARFGQDPNGTAAAYGRATNTCCFCRAELTDTRSVAAGYGPVCAGNYGLTSDWKKAAAAV